MLETIYEVDENLIPEMEKKSTRFLEQPSRLPYYICCCMILGCFLALSLTIAVSLNPYLLSKHSIQQNSKSILTVSIHSDDKSTIAIDLINHLDIFAHQVDHFPVTSRSPFQKINERLGLQPNTLTFSTSTISDSSAEQRILWIYSHINYPRSCFAHDQCRKHFHGKLKTSFTELSSVLASIKFHSSHDKRIQLDWCDLIENTTRTVLVSLASVTTINQSRIESTILEDRLHCENLDRNLLLSQAIDPTKQNDHPQDETKEEINFTSKHPIGFSQYTRHYSRKTRIQCPSDTNTRVLLASNFY